MVVTFPGSGQILVTISMLFVTFNVIMIFCQCEGIPGGPSGGQKPKLFGYNVVFEPGASQDDVLQYSGIKRIIEMAIEGFSCTAFCYGQTGSGKTHTLTGPPDLVHIFYLNFRRKFLKKIRFCFTVFRQETRSQR